MRDYKNIFFISLIIQMIGVGIIAFLDPYLIPLHNIYYFSLFIVIWVTFSKFHFHQSVLIRQNSMKEAIDYEISNNTFVLVLLLSSYILCSLIEIVGTSFFFQDGLLLLRFNKLMISSLHLLLVLLILNNILMSFEKENVKYVMAIVVIFLIIVFRYNDTIPQNINIALNLFYPVFHSLSFFSFVWTIFRFFLLFYLTHYLVICHYYKKVKFDHVKRFLKYLVPMSLVCFYTFTILNGKVEIDANVLLGLMNLNFSHFHEWGMNTINIVYISGFLLISFAILDDVLKIIKSEFSFYQMLAIRDSRWMLSFEKNVITSLGRELLVLYGTEIMISMIFFGMDGSLFLSMIGYFFKILLFFLVIVNITLFIGLIEKKDVLYFAVLLAVFGICIDLFLFSHVISFADSLKNELVYSLVYFVCFGLIYIYLNNHSNKRGDVL